MGWTYSYVPKERVKDEILAAYQWTGEGGKREVIAHSINVVKGVAYLAVRRTAPDGTVEVWAGVALVRFNARARDGLTFGIKEMDETVGPCEAECPERILRLLTPTTYEYAKAWRERCWARLAQKRARKPLREGATVKLPHPARYPTLGIECDTFTAHRRAPYLGGKAKWVFRTPQGHTVGLRRSTLATATIS